MSCLLVGQRGRIPKHAHLLLALAFLLGNCFGVSISPLQPQQNDTSLADLQHCLGMHFGIRHCTAHLLHLLSKTKLLQSRGKHLHHSALYLLPHVEPKHWTAKDTTELYAFTLFSPSLASL